MTDKKKHVTTNDKNTKYYSTRVTKDKANAQSALTTHNELVKLGGILALRKKEQEARLKEKKETFDFLLSYPLNNIEEVVKQQFRYKRKNDVIKLYTMFKKYIDFLENDIIEYAQKISELEDDNKFNNNEIENYINENDNLEEKLKCRELYWTNRVFKLRNKCIAKNHKLKMLKFILILSNGLTWHVTRVGINETFNEIVTIFSYFSFILFSIVHYFNFIIFFIINFICNFVDFGIHMPKYFGFNDYIYWYIPMLVILCTCTILYKFRKKISKIMSIKQD